jgi:hypothetical protein
MEDSTSLPCNWLAPDGVRAWIQVGDELMLRVEDISSLYHPWRSPSKHWWISLFYLQTLARDRWLSKLVLECYARIICQALEVPQDCKRKLLDDETHDLRIFTNPRVIQVYCCHNKCEKAAYKDLALTHFCFDLHRRKDKVDGLNYEEFTRDAYWRASKYLAWECILPCGIDMEALSPRDANAHLRAKQPAPKSKPPVPKAAQKGKDHPPPPPPEVREPPCSDRRHGAIYRTGKCLGVGGFAVCYEGQLAGTKQLYALKMVKSHMPTKKIEQKVVSGSLGHEYAV